MDLQALDNLIDEFLPRHRQVTSAPSDEENDSDSDRGELIHSNRVHDDVLRERIDLFTRSNGDDYSEEIESEDDDNVSCNGNSDIQSLKEKVLTSCSCGKKLLRQFSVR